MDDMTRVGDLAPTLASLGARYDHTAIAGPSMRPLLAFYRDVLGAEFRYGEVLPIGAVVIALFLGETKIELMAPTPGSSFFDRFFAATEGRGGVHHLTFEVPDIDAAHEVLRSHGVATFGLAYDEFWSEVFVHPRANGGVLVQLAQIGDYSSVVGRDFDTLMAAAL
jgi:methylmalonyl-CoA/ethylmalonyl-CoA epimerase